MSLIPVAIGLRRRWHRWYRWRWWQICHRYHQHWRKWWKNLPPVSLIPVVRFHLRISPRIFEKIRNGPNGILWGWGQTDSSKNQMQKISWHSPFELIISYCQPHSAYTQYNLNLSYQNYQNGAVSGQLTDITRGMRMCMDVHCHCLLVSPYPLNNEV